MSRVNQETVTTSRPFNPISGRLPQKDGLAVCGYTQRGEGQCSPLYISRECQGKPFEHI